MFCHRAMTTVFSELNCPLVNISRILQVGEREMARSMDLSFATGAVTFPHCLVSWSPLLAAARQPARQAAGYVYYLSIVYIRRVSYVLSDAMKI